MALIKAVGKRTPLYRDTSFGFDSIGQAEETFIQEEEYPQSSENFIYTRYANPTVQTTEQVIADLENSQWALLVSSGMAAIDVALSSYQKGDETGTWLFFSELYGGANTYIDTMLVERRGIKVERFNIEKTDERYDLARLAEVLDTVKPRLLYFETISNPLLITADGGAVIRLAKERGIAVVVDNTFGTPYLWQPLADGADLVIHSATKYLSGHGNLTAGVVCGNDPELKKSAMLYRKFVGPILSPDDAYRLDTQLRTFRMRFAAQCENAFRLAKRLEAHPAVRKVRYPGIESHVTYPEAKKMFGDRGYGAMLNIDLEGGRAACDAFLGGADGVVSYTPTLGDDQTILLHVSTVWDAKRFPFPGMLRISIGFEPYETLEEGFLKALA